MITIFRLSLWIFAGLMAVGLPVTVGALVGTRFGKPLWALWQTQWWCRWLYAVFVVGAVALLQVPNSGVAVDAGQFILAELLLMSSMALAVGRWAGKKGAATAQSPDRRWRWRWTLPLVLVPMLGLNLYVSSQNTQPMVFRGFSLETMLGVVTGLTWIGIGVLLFAQPGLQTPNLGFRGARWLGVFMIAVGIALSALMLH